MTSTALLGGFMVRPCQGGDEVSTHLTFHEALAKSYEVGSRSACSIGHLHEIEACYDPVNLGPTVNLVSRTSDDTGALLQGEVVAVVDPWMQELGILQRAA